MFSDILGYVFRIFFSGYSKGFSPYSGYSKGFSPHAELPRILLTRVPPVLKLLRIYNAMSINSRLIGLIIISAPELYTTYLTR